MDNKFSANSSIPYVSTMGWNITTKTNHPRINGQEVLFNKTLVLRLRLYVADIQRNWEILV